MQFDQLKRRAFMALLGGAATWPVMARAQQAGNLLAIGFLGLATPSPEGEWIAAGSVCARANTLLAQLNTLRR